MHRLKFTSLVFLSCFIGMTAFWTYRLVVRPDSSYLISQARFLSESSANSLKQNISETEVLMDDTDYALLQPAQRASPTFLNSNNDKCQWAEQRIRRLDSTIRQSGTGSFSQYCEELSQRRSEFLNFNCKVKLSKRFYEFC